VVEKPADLLAHAQKHAPGGDGAERETRTSWIVADEDAPLGEWWIAKCCGRVFDHSAKLGGHSCEPGLSRSERFAREWKERQRALAAPRRAKQKRERERAAAADARRAAAARPWYRFW